VDDELLAIDGIRVRADKLDERLEQYRPGDTLGVLVARRERLRTVTLVARQEPPRQWRLEIAPAPTTAQARQLEAWLRG
jgi:predicted metalloprotease with PDZ domain